MRKLPELEVMKRAVRARVCTQCVLRPPGSECLGPGVPRRCEGECTIFINLAEMRQIVEAMGERPYMQPYERAMRELVCVNCNASPTAGDYCDQRTQRSCPLSLYGRDVIAALEQVEARASGTRGPGGAADGR